jgi:hypothetical protein
MKLDKKIALAHATVPPLSENLLQHQGYMIKILRSDEIFLKDIVRIYTSPQIDVLHTRDIKM